MAPHSMIGPPLVQLYCMRQDQILQATSRANARQAVNLQVHRPGPVLASFEQIYENEGASAPRSRIGPAQAR
jgi:hypothetical protein